jgi:hypothetical protein
MSWRAIALCGAVAAGLSCSAAPNALAKDRGDGDHRAGYTYGGGQGYGQCSEIYDRIDFDRSKIEEIRPTGRHKKALQWYVDDLRNAERDLDRCRYGGDTAGYDPYGWDGRDAEYDDSDRPFDWKRDWPELLGAVLYPTR